MINSQNFIKIIEIIRIIEIKYILKYDFPQKNIIIMLQIIF